MLDDQHLSILSFFLTHYLSEYSDQWNVLSSLPFGEDYVELKRLPSNQRVAFAVRCNMGESIVKQLHTLGNELPANICEMVTRRNHMRLLRYAHTHKCAWGNTVKIATARGYVACLHEAFWNGCPIESTLVELAAEKGQLNSLKYLNITITFHLTVSASIAAAKHGHLNFLQYIHKQGVPLTLSVACWAAKGGHLDCLIYAHQNGCSLASEVVECACERGDLACMHYAVKHGCDVTAHASTVAAYNGRLTCLQYAHKLGGEWSEETCLNTASYGHLHCLRYLHEHGCPWDETLLIEALWEDHLDITLYTLLQRCPCAEHAEFVDIYGLYLFAIVQYCIRLHVFPWYCVLLMVVVSWYATVDVLLHLYQHKVKKRYPHFPVQRVLLCCNYINMGLTVVKYCGMVYGGYVVYTWVRYFAGFDVPDLPAQANSYQDSCSVDH